MCDVVLITSMKQEELSGIVGLKNRTNGNNSMTDHRTKLPKWLVSRHYCTVKDLMRLFEVSRATIDRWCRENPAFPAKVKLGNPFNENRSTRFVVAEVAVYLEMLEGRGGLECDEVA